MSEVLIQTALSMERAGKTLAAREAARLYREILERHPGHFQAVYSLAQSGICHRPLRTSAERLFAQAAAINPHAADVQFAHGCALQRMGRNEAAVAVFDKAIALDRRHVDALVNRAVALVAVRRLKLPSARCLRQASARCSPDVRSCGARMAMRWPRQVNSTRRCRATTRRSHCGRTIPKLGTIAAPHTSPSSATRRRWRVTTRSS